MSFSNTYTTTSATLKAFSQVRPALLNTITIFKSDNLLEDRCWLNYYEEIVDSLVREGFSLDEGIGEKMFDKFYLLKQQYKFNKLNFKRYKKFVKNCLNVSFSLDSFKNKYFKIRNSYTHSKEGLKLLFEIENKFNLINKNIVLQYNKLCEKKAYFNLNKFNYNLLILERCPDWIPDHDIEYLDLSIPSIKKKNNFIYTPSQLRPMPENIYSPLSEEIYSPSYIKSLYVKIGKILAQFKYNRSSKTIKYYIDSLRNSIISDGMLDEYEMAELNECEEAVPQMDTDAHGDGGISEDQAGNVVLTTARDASATCTSESQFNWSNAVSSDIKGSYSEMTDRWFKFYDFEWKSEKSANTQIGKIILPLDAIKNKDWAVCDVPNFIPFKVHRYWRGDMEVRIQINSNKFQIGQLQVAWYYEPWYDDKFNLRESIFSMSQVEHVLINAGSSNEAILKIPFKNHLGMLSTKHREDSDNNLKLGMLYINVLNPLTVGEGGPMSCYGSVFLRFLNNVFTGQISGRLDEIAEPQMNTAFNIAAGILKNLDVPNCDNPPQPRNPSYLVPTASHSWAYGTGDREPLHSFRLDPRGQVQHPDKLSDETRIKDVASKYGLVKTIEWSKNLARGAALMDCDAAPILEKSDYKTEKGVHSNLDTYVLPPVAVVTSMFNFWRGSLRFRFDIVASQFHTGRIVIGYVPGATESSGVTLQDILAGPHMVFTLQEDQQFVYEIPYVTDKPFWFKRYMGNFSRDQVSAPSRLYMFVLNPLIPMQSVADKVFINMYMCAGNSFEVSVPVQPSIGCGFDTTVIYDKSELIFAQEGYYPYFFGFWRGFGSSTKLCARTSEVSDHYAIFDPKFLLKTDPSKGIVKDTLCYYYTISDLSQGPRVTINGRVRAYIYAILIWFDFDKRYACLIPIANERFAQLACTGYYRNNNDPANILKYCITSADDSKNTFGIGNPAYVVHSIKYDPDVKYEEVEAYDSDGYEIVQPEGEVDDGENVITTGMSLMSLGDGMSLFGERFDSLKDITRRYQVYTSFKVYPNDMKQLGQCSCIIPLLPQGLNLNMGTPSNIIEVPNRCRDGIIPVVLSGFRYYRGSMRIRLVLPTTRDVIIWLQHRPDRKLRSLTPIRCASVITAESIANHGYASYIQDTGVNSIVELEIPFYQNGAYGLLQRPKILTTQESYHYSLGELCIGFIYSARDGGALRDFVATVYYSMGDDMQISTFQGFPPMVLLDDLSDANPNVAEPQGLGDWFVNSPAVQGLKDEIKEEVKETVAEQLEPVVNIAHEEISRWKTMFNKAGLSDIFNHHIIRSIIGHISHIVANFNWKSICIGIAHICLEIGIITMESISLMINLLESLFKKWKLQCSRSGDQLNPPDIATEALEETASPQDGGMSDSDGAAVGIITLIWTSVCGLLNIVVKKPGKDLAAWAKLLTIDMGNVFRGGNSVFTFIRNIFSVLEPMKIKIFGILSPECRAARRLTDEYAELKAWVENVNIISDPLKFDKERYFHGYKQSVNVAYLTGLVFQSRAMDIRDRSVVDIITRAFARITELREKMVLIGDDNYVRFEPFTMWQYGAPGVGKSFIMDDLCKRLLSDLRITTNVPPIYNHNVASDHWDSCQNNPVMLIDDMLCVQSGTMMERYLSVLFAVVSPVVLTPPKAAIHDKGKAYSGLRLFAINSNYGYPRIPNVQEDAVNRRRDVLWEACLIDFAKNPHKKKDGCRHCELNLTPAQANPEDLKDYHHLEFIVKKSVLTDVGGYAPMNYTEFYHYLRNAAEHKITKNRIIYEQRVKSTIDSITRSMGDHMNDESIADLVIAYQNSMHESCQELIEQSWKELIRKEVDDVWDSILDHMDSLTNISWISRMMYRPKGSRRRGSAQTSASTSSFDPYAEAQGPFEEVDAFGEDMYKHNDVLDEIERLRNDPVAVIDHAQEENGYGSHYDYLYAACTSKFCEPSKECNYGHILAFIQGVTIESRRGVILPGMIIPSFQSFVRNYPRAAHTLVNCMGIDMCHHFYVKFSNLIYDPETEGLYVGGPKGKKRNVFLPCDLIRDFVKKKKVPHDDAVHVCCLNNEMFKFLFCESVLMYNPKWKSQFQVQRKECMKKIPPIFRIHNVVNMVDESQWKIIMGKVMERAISSIKFVSEKAKKFFFFLKNNVTEIMLWFSVLTMFLGTVTMCVGTVAAYNQITNAPVETSWVPESSAYKDVPTKINLNAQIPKVVPQSECPQLDIAKNRILENFFTVTAISDNKKYSFTGLVIRDRSLLLIKHFLEFIRLMPGEVVFFGKYSSRKNYLEGSMGVEFDFKTCKRIEYNKVTHDGQCASNFIVMQLPVKFPQAKDLTRFFATEKQHVLHTGDGLLIENTGIIHQNLNVIRENARPLIIGETSTSSRVILQDVYSYKLQGKGMCGSIVLSRNLERPIIGMHVAGITGGNVRGIAEILNYEIFNAVDKMIDLPYKESIIPDLTDSEFSKINVDSIIYPFGCTDSKMTAHQGGETSIIPSLVHGVFPVVTEPNPLKKNDPRLPEGAQPLADGIAHMGKPPRDFDTVDLVEASFDLKRVILNNVKPVRSTVGKVSLEDVICGNKNIQGFEPLEWSTSPGYPLRFQRDTQSQSGKKWLFKLDEQPDGYKLLGLHPKLESLLTFDQNCRNRGIKPFTVFIDCLKDTCLPVEKCSIRGKTRIFSISPVQFTIQFKQYFLDFTAAYQKSRFESEHAIGIDCDSCEWTELAGVLQQKGEKIICGDYKNYGPGLMLKAAEYAFQIILDWYVYHGDESNNAVRRIMVSEILGCYHLATNLIYTTPCGIPSGSPITTPLNSLVGSLYVRVMWKRITNLSFRDMHNHCKIITYGDDVCINISDEICDVFNTDTMCNEFSKYNIIFTDADKSDNIVKYRSLLDSSFLKRNFVPHPTRQGLWLAKLDKKSVEGCANWIHKKNNKVSATIQNCEQAIMLAHGNGKEYYEEVCLKLLKACSFLNEPLMFDSWDMLDHKRYGQ